MPVKFDSATVRFSQDGNTMGTTDTFESLEVNLLTQVPGEEPFVVLKTEGWSLDSLDELKLLVDRCMRITEVPDERKGD